MNLAERLVSGPPLLLDGAMGTELERRGVDVSLPLWSAAAVEEHPEIVQAIHSDHVSAGAEIITTATFRTLPRTFMKITDNLDEAAKRAKDAALTAVALTKRAAGEKALVAGSVAPLEDCYTPELFPGVETAVAEFRQLGEWLTEGGVDLILIEAMSRIDEVSAALEATNGLGLSRWVSFIVSDVEHLLSGDSLESAVRVVEEDGADAVLVNCSEPHISVAALDTMSQFTDLPLGLYPNLGHSDPDPDGVTSEIYPETEFMQIMTRAIQRGARIVGGCCGSSPKHIAELAKNISGLQL